MVSNQINQLAILGASGHGKVIADLAEQLGYVVSFYDDIYPQKQFVAHWPILGNIDDLSKLDTSAYVVTVAIGDNNARQCKLTQLCLLGFEAPYLIHPSANISNYADLGFGVVCLANSVVNAFAKIGNGSIINSGSVVEHDCIIDEFVHISPNASLAGNVTVGELSWIGLGSQVRQMTKIGKNTVIGAGSTVVNDIPSNVVAFGSPAVVQKYNR